MFNDHVALILYDDSGNLIPDRSGAFRYGLNIADIHQSIQTAIGGIVVSTTIEGRKRFQVQVRYDFAGNYQAALDFNRNLMFVVPVLYSLREKVLKSMPRGGKFSSTKRKTIKS